MNMIVVSYSENSCYVTGKRVLFMHQKYTMALSSNNYLFFVVALKIAGISVSFSSSFKILFHNFGTRIVILYLLFVSLKEDTI